MKIQKNNINFQAGLTKQIRSEIASSNVKQISDYISKNGIPNDFKENKLIAWCSLKCLEIIKTLNKEYNLRLGLPKGIFVEDFHLLNVSNQQSAGVTNFAPCQLHLKNKTIFPEKTIFFNEFKGFNYSGGNEYWDRIDLTADANYDDKISATDFFMEIFFHEFAHAIHEENLIKKLGGEKTVSTIYKLLNPKNTSRFQNKNRDLLDSICKYASSNPFEAVACDLSKRFIENVNKNKLTIEQNFISKSPYRKHHFFLLPFTDTETNPLSHLLRKCWNGKFER